MKEGDIDTKRDEHHRKHTYIIIISLIIVISIITVSLLVHYKKIIIS